MFRAKQYLDVLKQEDTSALVAEERDRHYAFIFEYPVLITEFMLNLQLKRFDGIVIKVF